MTEKKPEEIRITPDITRMVPYNMDCFLKAEGVPGFPQKVAYSLLSIALDEAKKDVSIIDPFCGNGTILMMAGSNFPGVVKNVFGYDVNPQAVEAARMNLEELGSMRMDCGVSFPFVNVETGNALTFQLPPKVLRPLVVTDPPYGRRSQFRNQQGEVAPLDMRGFFRNLRSNQITRAVFSLDDSTVLEELENPDYRISEVYHNWDRNFYLAKIAKK